MARDLYRVAHKAMRRDLFEVSASIAATDFSSSSSVTELCDRFAGLVASMGHHAELEDGELHPLVREAGSSVLASIESEHELLDAELEALAGLLEGLPIGDDDDVWDRAHEFYLRFNRFVADYLRHIDLEERELMPVLASSVDADHLDQLAEGDYRGPLEMLVGAMGNMMPLFNVADRRQVVADIAAVRTSREFEVVADAGRAALGEAEWARLLT